ncbi:hypothetical protein D3C87_1450940 [compost metagenome]|uniref:type II toxin-antitoxin system HicA family toxin n=1 Tax=Sphingobacterium faecium TaxID=34087 RepID=UPI0005F2CBC6
MGNNRPVKVKCWEKYLISIGCTKKRIQSSHHHWGCPGCLRNIVLQGAEKDIPPFHIKTNLKSLGVNAEDFYKWAEENC